MSTRGLIIIKTGEFKSGFYNHFDSYPKGGLGADVVEWIIKRLKGPKSIQKMRDNTLALKEVDDSKAPTKEEVNYYVELTGSWENAPKDSKPEWYGLLHGFQGVDGLEAIFKGQQKHFENAIDFLNDTLFCEYAYLIDLDAKELKCFAGGAIRAILPFKGITVEEMLVRMEGWS